MKPSELDPERWREIDALLGEALERPPPRRHEFLAQVCRGDEALRSEVEDLLAAHESAGDRFERPPGLPVETLLDVPPALPANRGLGPFRLVEELGRGGMGVVYLAEDTRLGRRVALKVLPPYLGVGPDAKRRFAAEARAVSRLDHPNVATLYEIGESDAGQLYMAFAHYEGETLKARIARGALPVDEALGIAAKVAAGLVAAHRQGIIHRDVKPSNVLLTDTGEVKLLDFGVAKVAGEEVTGEGIGLGTVAYMSPEQAAGESVDHRTDLWSLGVVLHEMLDGARPFRAGNSLSLRHAILHEEPPLPGASRRDVPDAVLNVVRRLLEKDPADRHGNAHELLEELDAVASGAAAAFGTMRATSSVPPAPGPPARPRPRRARSRATLVALALTASAAALWLGQSPQPTSSGAEFQRLAVLPLANLTGDPEQQYFVDGIHDGLVAELGRIGSFGVISRTTVMPYRDSEMTVPEIAAELGVQALVEGSVFRQGDSLVVTAQLIAASPERQLWANRYHRSADEVLMIAAEIAQSIAYQAGIPRTTEETARVVTAPRVASRSYEAYLRGWHHWERRTRDGFDLARSYFRQAIEIDSTFAPAYAGLAETHNGAAEWLLAEPAESFERARDLARTALAIDSTLPEAYAALAAIEWMHEWDWEQARRLASTAVELNPSDVNALRYLGHALRGTGRREEARAVFDRANRLDTQIPGIGTAFASYASRELDRVIEHARIAQEFDESLWQAPWLICMSLALKELHEQAIAQCEAVATRFGRRNPLLLASLGYTYALGGQPEEASGIVEELEELADSVYVAPALNALLYGALGETDRAFDWLERAYQERDTFLMKLHLPFFDPVRSDPRFDLLIEKIGLGAS